MSNSEKMDKIVSLASDKSIGNKLSQAGIREI